MSDSTRKRPKRFLLWVVACAMLVSLVACGAAGNGTGTQEQAQPAATEEAAKATLDGWKDDSAALASLK